MCVGQLTDNTFGGFGVKARENQTDLKALVNNLTRDGALTLQDGSIVNVKVSTQSSGHNSERRTTVYTFPRQLRENPWYIDYDDANGKRQRAWFNLDL